MAELPVLYVSEAEINERRAAYEQCLKELCRADANVAKGVGSSQPFYLAYQGRNDRDLQALYGSLVSRVMGERYPPARLASPPSASEPVRVGIVSGFFRNHANWRLPIKGWLSQLDRRQFRLFGYYTGGWRTTRQALQAPCANVSSKVHDRSKAGEPKYWPMPHMF
jgi:predicted O-linked N-acetylglucosamine transferase (SPINDLY family)